MKQTTNALFDLVHSMSKNEKSFFVRFIQLSGRGKNYLKIYKEVERLEFYDKVKLIKKLEGIDKVEIGKNLAADQHNLYKLILKSLRLFHEAKFPDNQLFCQVMEADILYSKGLKRQALKKLEMAKKTARSIHSYTALIEILKRITSWTLASDQKNLLVLLKKNYEEVENGLKVLEEEYIIRKYNHFMLTYYRLNKVNAQKEFGSKIEEIISLTNILISNSPPFSFFSKYLLQNIKTIQYLLSGNRKEAQKYYEEILKAWEEYPEMQKAYPQLYFINISNYLTNSIFSGMNSKVDYYFKKISKIKSRHLVEQIEYFQNIIYLKIMQVLYDPDQLYHNLTFESELRSGLQQYKDYLVPSRAISIYYNMLMVHFLREEFKLAEEYLMKINNQDKGDSKEDITSFVRILSIVIHFCNDDHSNLDNVLISIKRHYRSSNLNDPYIEILLKYFWQLLNAVKGKPEIKIMFDFRNDLGLLRSQKPKPLCIEELLLWLESRIQNKPIIDIFVKERDRILN